MLPVTVSTVGGNNIPNSVKGVAIVLDRNSYQLFSAELKQLCHKKTGDFDENYLTFYGAIKNFLYTDDDENYLCYSLSSVPAFKEIAYVEQGNHTFYAYFVKSPQASSKLLITDKKITEEGLVQTAGEVIRIQVDIDSKDDFADFRKQLPTRTGVASVLSAQLMNYYADNTADAATTTVMPLAMRGLQNAYNALLVLYQQYDRGFAPRDLMIYEQPDAFALKMESGVVYYVWTNEEGKQEKSHLFNVCNYSLTDLMNQFNAFALDVKESFASPNEQEQLKILRNLLISYLMSNRELLQVAVVVFQGSKTIDEVDGTLMEGVVSYLSMCPKSEGESYVVNENTGLLDGRHGLSLEQWATLQDPYNSTAKAHFIELVTLALKFKEILCTVMTTLRAKLDEAGVEGDESFNKLVEEWHNTVMLKIGMPSQVLQALCCKVNAGTEVDFISDQNWSTALEFYKAYASEAQ